MRTTLPHPRQRERDLGVRPYGDARTRRATDDRFAPRYADVLVPLDGSDLTARALSHLPRVADRADTLVTLLHVIDVAIAPHVVAAAIPGVPTVLPVRSTEELITTMTDRATLYLGDLRAQLQHQGFQRVEIAVRRGGVKETILDAARSCDLVLLGTRRRSFLSRFVYGSVADHVVKHARQSALLVVQVEG